jgi:uroporphyrinogen decarboxylase
MNDSVTQPSRARYLKALAGEPVDRPPAWIMRQAGRYLPEYRALRAEHSFLECVHEPSLAVEITLQPLRRFPLDAAIVFSDILIVLEALGQEVTFPKGGPRIAPALEDADLACLRQPDPERDFAYLATALRMLREELGDERALLGFAGAPFTLACYAVQGAGSKDWAAVRKLMYGEPERFGALLERISDCVAELLLLQLRSGADAVQLFDTWAGTLSLEDYRRIVAPGVKRIVDRVHEAGGKIVLYQKDGAHLLEEAIASGADAVGLDWRVDPGRAAELAQGRCALQGNMDPGLLFAPPEEIEGRVRAIHEAIGGRTGHVFNLGHGIMPSAPIAGVEAFLAAVAALAEDS